MNPTNPNTLKSEIEQLTEKYFADLESATEKLEEGITNVYTKLDINDTTHQKAIKHLVVELQSKYNTNKWRLDRTYNDAIVEYCHKQQ